LLQFTFSALLQEAMSTYKTFLKDIDRQEIIIFNLQMAIQNCIDIEAHIVSDEGLRQDFQRRF